MLREKLRLYLITNRNRSVSERKFLYIIEQAILGGVTAVQLREKDLEFDQCIRLAKQCKKITTKYKVPLFINDNISIAKEVHAEGLHVGQSDIGLKKARQILEKDCIIGISINHANQLNDEQNQYADYLSISPIFSTKTKLDITEPINLDALSSMVKTKTKPTIAIGGITLDNVESVMKQKVDGVAVSAAIFNNDNPYKQAQRFKDIINKITLEA